MEIWDAADFAVRTSVCSHFGLSILVKSFTAATITNNNDALVLWCFLSSFALLVIRIITYLRL